MMQVFPNNAAYIHLLIIDYFYCLGDNAFENAQFNVRQQSNKQKADEIKHTEENQHVWEMWTT